MNVTVNKRLDEWVTESWLDTRKVQFPRPTGGSTTAGGTGTCTPKKQLIGTGAGGTVVAVSSVPVIGNLITNNLIKMYADCIDNYLLVLGTVQVATPAESERTVQPSGPTSPLAATELVNGGAVLDAALHKRMNRKKKATAIESEVVFIVCVEFLMYCQMCGYMNVLLGLYGRWRSSS